MIMMFVVHCGQQVYITQPALVPSVVVDDDTQVLHVGSQSTAEQAGMHTDVFL